MLFKQFENIINKKYKAGIIYKLRDILVSFILHFILGFISYLLMLFLDFIIVKFSDFSPIIKSHLNIKDTFGYYGYVYGTFIVVFGAPIVEELCFRLFLSISKLHVAISVSTLFFFLSGPIWFIDDLSIYIIRGLFSFFIYMFVLKYWNKDWRILKHERLNYFLLIVSSLVFGITHLFNFYPIQFKILFLYPLYVMPQIFMGFILGILRLKNGFFWAILFHIVVNFYAITR